ncbi:MAG: ribonuclease R [Bacteroidetes bacterium]|nr:ribonuclease R [Bacteroidota bacterium]
MSKTNNEVVVKLFTSRPNLSAKSKEVAHLLKINNHEEYQSLRSTLHKLVESGALNFDLKTGYKLNSKKIDKKGILKLLKNNIGIVALQDNSEVLISSKNIFTALDGDEVEINIFSKSTSFNNKIYNEGKIVKILNRGKHVFIGTIEKSKKATFVVCDDKKLKRDFYISKEFELNSNPGDRVVVEFIEWESEDFNPEGKIIEILGKAGDPFTEIKSVLRAYNLTPTFPKVVESEVAQFTNTISEKELLQREDCRKLNCVTIDPVDAKDFDDALSIGQTNSNSFELGVHIADVSFFVKQNSELDFEALSRGTSVYLANQVVPMLPERLSNNLCSLKPETDRLAFSCFIKFENGKIISHRFSKTVINSKKRFTYEEVEKILDSGKGKFTVMISQLWDIASKLKKERFKKGGINFETLEPKFEYDSFGKPTEIFIKHRLKSHQLVEECMLLANKLVAEEVNKYIISDEAPPFIYRVHAEPEKVKLNTLKVFVSKFGFNFNLTKNIHNELQNLLNQVENKPEENIVNEITLRSMAKAIYDTVNIGHFGLAFKDYTHFTSPIRRYPDLIVHRLLYYYMTKNKNNKIPQLLYSLEELKEISKHTSQREKIAQDAERDTIKIMQLEYMKNFIGEEYVGIISGVLNFGFFVELEQTLVEGLVPVRNLKDDYYEFNEQNFSLIGRRTGRTYRLGDSIKVKVISVNPESRKIDFAIINPSEPFKGLSNKRKK